MIIYAVGVMLYSVTDFHAIEMGIIIVTMIINFMLTK